MNKIFENSDFLLESIDAKINKFSNSLAIETETHQSFQFGLLQSPPISVEDFDDRIQENEKSFLSITDSFKQISNFSGSTRFESEEKPFLSQIDSFITGQEAGDSLNAFKGKFNQSQILLQKFLSNQKLVQKDIDQLQQDEILIVKCLLKKYYHKQQECIQMLNLEQNLLKTLKFIQNQISKKRTEEKKKIIFKLIFKKMIKKFEKKNFYDFYFGQISQKKKIPLNVYYKPNKKRNSDSCQLNNNYLLMVFQSLKFRKEFSRIMNEELIELYSKNVQKQLSRLFGKIKGFKDPIDFLEKNQRLKIPWNITDIKDAIKYFKKKFKI